jgi:hypothetical protein
VGLGVGTEVGVATGMARCSCVVGAEEEGLGRRHSRGAGLREP